jgi:hypothetical protein
VQLELQLVVLAVLAVHRQMQWVVLVVPVVLATWTRQAQQRAVVQLAQVVCRRMRLAVVAVLVEPQPQLVQVARQQQLRVLVVLVVLASTLASVVLVDLHRRHLAVRPLQQVVSVEHAVRRVLEQQQLVVSEALLWLTVVHKLLLPAVQAEQELLLVRVVLRLQSVEVPRTKAPLAL